MYEPVFRKLVNESLGVFQSLVKLSEEEKVVGLESLVKVSRQYRSIMKDCQEQLESLAETVSTTEFETRSLMSSVPSSFVSRLGM